MRRQLPIAVLALLWSSAFASMESDGTWKAGVWSTTVWADGVWFEEEDLFPLTDVRGQANFAAADAVLEGDGFDAGSLSPQCSAAPADQIVGQSPFPGTLVPLGTVANLFASNGTECPQNTRRRISIGIAIGVGK